MSHLYWNLHATCHPRGNDIPTLTPANQGRDAQFSDPGGMQG